MAEGRKRQASFAGYKRSSTAVNFQKPDSANSTFRSNVRDDDVLSESTLDMECDFANGLYFRTLITNQMIEETVAKKIEDMSDQLSFQLEVLNDLEDKKFNLEKNVKRLELNAEIMMVYKRLNEVYSEITKMLDEYNVDNNLNECVRIGSRIAYNKLYLKNIKPFENDKEYDKFLGVIKCCIESLKKLQNISCHNIQEVQLLRDTVANYKELQTQVINKRQFLIERQKDITFNALKSLSDKFAESS